MFPLSSANGISQDDQPNIDGSGTHVVSVSRSDRWRIARRLQELMIPCWCPEDGSLRVEVQNCIGVLLLRSVVQQFVARAQRW